MAFQDNGYHHDRHERSSLSHRQDYNSRYNRQDSNNRYDRQDIGRNDRGDSNRSSRIEQRFPNPRYEGIVKALKEEAGFGFIHCLEMKQDIFFHESEVPQRSADEDHSLPHVQVLREGVGRW